MLTKSKIALSAMLVFGFASAALANGTNGYRVGDTWIEPSVQESATATAFASATTERRAPYSIEEQRLTDRASGYGFTW